MTEDPSPISPPQAPAQPQMPALPWERAAKPSQKPPWKPRVIQGVGLVFGPLAAAIVTFINFRRMGAPRKAQWTLWLSVFGCAAFGAFTFRFSEEMTTPVSQLIGYLFGPVLYPLLQRTEFKKWEDQNPGATTSNGWRTTGWGILGLIGFFMVTFAGAAPMLFSEKVENIQVTIRAPEKVAPGQKFVVEVEAENTADKPQVLISMDLNRSYLEAVILDRTDPPFSRSEPHELMGGINSYYFNREIPGKGKTAVRLQFFARTVGQFPGELGVCIHTDTNCHTYSFTTQIAPAIPAAHQ